MPRQRLLRSHHHGHPSLGRWMVADGEWRNKFVTFAITVFVFTHPLPHHPLYIISLLSRVYISNDRIMDEGRQRGLNRWWMGDTRSPPDNECINIIIALWWIIFNHPPQINPYIARWSSHLIHAGRTDGWTSEPMTDPYTYTHPCVAWLVSVEFSSVIQYSSQLWPIHLNGVMAGQVNQCRCRG